MTGTFVPLFDPPLRGKQSARVGWIVAETGCHLWQGARDPKGYGRVRIDGRTLRVHRVRYAREVGPIPEGLPLDHFVCDNGPGGCCNPHHVRPATNRENVLRGTGITAANAAKTHCLRGHLFAGDNLRVDPRDGERRCRACDRLGQRRRRAHAHLEVARGA